MPKKSFVLIDFLIYSLFLILLLLTLDGLLPQFQLFLTQQVLLPNVVLRPVAFILLISILIIVYKLNLRLKKIQIIYLIVLIIYLLAISIYQIAALNATYSDTLYVLNNYYFWIVMVIPFLTIYKFIRERVSFQLMMYISLPIIILGIYQSLSGDILLYQRSADNSFYVSAIYFFGKVRAFSIFTSGYAFGQFLCLALAFALSMQSNRRLVHKIAMPIFILIAIYFTYTRAIYICSGLILFYYLCNRVFGGRSSIYYPAISLIAGLLIIQIPTQGTANSDLFSQSTSLERLDNWQNIISSWISDPLNINVPLPIILGDGRFQNIRFAQFEQITIDNSFVSILINAGAIGLMLFVCGYILVYAFIISEYYERRINLSAVIFASTFPFLSMFNNAHTNFYLLVLLSIFISPDSRKKSLNYLRARIINWNGR
jgi:hypothetical protein